METLLAINSFIFYIYKYKEDFSKFTTSAFGSFKSKYKSECNILNKEITELNFEKDHFNKIFHNIFVLYYNIKIKEQTILKDCLYSQIYDLINQIVKKDTLICNCSFSDEQLDDIHDKILHLESTIQNPTNQNVQSSQHNPNNKPTSVEKLISIDPSKFVNLELSRPFLLSLFDKLLRYKNHIKVNQDYKNNNTTPSALFYNRFPEPHLIDDPEFVNEYNARISKFQNETMSSIIEHYKNRTNIIEKKLSEIKITLIENNNENTINQEFERIENTKKEELKEKFAKAHNKVLRAKSQPFIASIYKNQNNTRNKDKNYNTNRNRNNNNNNNKKSVSFDESSLNNTSYNNSQYSNDTNNEINSPYSSYNSFPPNQLGIHNNSNNYNHTNNRHNSYAQQSSSSNKQYQSNRNNHNSYRTNHNYNRNNQNYNRNNQNHYRNNQNNHRNSRQNNNSNINSNNFNPYFQTAPYLNHPS